MIDTNTGLCVYCGKVLSSETIAARGGMAHPFCYRLRQVPPMARTISDVLFGGDQGESANAILFVLRDFPDVERRIVESYNRTRSDAYVEMMRGYVSEEEKAGRGMEGRIP